MKTRFDVISILYDSATEPQIRHIQNALRHFHQLQVLVHCRLAQAGISIGLTQTLALHQQGLGAVNHTALLRAGAELVDLVARIGQLLAQRLLLLEAGHGHVQNRADALGLQAKGFINETRVLESVVHRRASKLGASRIKQELQSKGLEPEAVAEAVERLRASELERAREVWRKKFGTQPRDAAERGKQMRFLASRGFGGDTIHRVVQGADDE